MTNAIKRASLLTDITATKKGDAQSIDKDGDSNRVYKATVTGTGAVAATIVIYGNDVESNSGGVALGTITLSGTTSASDGFASNAPWAYVYADLTAISGTGAKVNAGMSG